jgi:electron transfer flavoprotein beta subunit
MNIVVCIKRVPATDTKIKIGADGKSIDPTGVQYQVNEYDKYGVEQAIKTKEQLGKGTITVVCLGGQDAKKELKSLLALDVDKAVLLNDGGKQNDAYSTAEILAAWLRANPHDLVFLGKQAMDMDNTQMASRLAALLGHGCVIEVSKLTLEGTSLTAERDIEGAREVVTCKLPAVISCNKGLNNPRSPTPKGIMGVGKKPLEEQPAAAFEAATKVASLALPPEKPPARIVGTGPAAVPALIQALRTEAKAL